MKLLERSPRPFLFADAEADYGHALLAAGRRDAGVPVLNRAWDRFHALGARSDAERVQRSLQRTGVRHARWATRTAKPLTGREALTATEQRVAQLIFQGHTNRSAASVLALSSHTVATHLRAIFGKFGVNSRVQLMHALIDQLAPGSRDRTRHRIREGDGAGGYAGRRRRANQGGSTTVDRQDRESCAAAGVSSHFVRNTVVQKNIAAGKTGTRAEAKGGP